LGGRTKNINGLREKWGSITVENDRGDSEREANCSSVITRDEN